MSKKIPEFKNYKEEAEFWDTHSFSDYWDDLPDTSLTYTPSAINKEVMTVRVDPSLKKAIKTIADKKELTYSSLVRSWLVLCVREELDEKYTV